MTMDSALFITLAVLVLAVAGWTILARDDYAAVVGFVTYGLLLSLVWVSLCNFSLLAFCFFCLFGCFRNGC